MIIQYNKKRKKISRFKMSLCNTISVHTKLLYILVSYEYDYPFMEYCLICEGGFALHCDSLYFHDKGIKVREQSF